MHSRYPLFSMCVALALTACATAPTSITVTAASNVRLAPGYTRVTFPGEGGVSLVGHLQLPADVGGGGTEKKRAAIVFQHGCGGPGTSGRLSLRHQAAMDWATARGMVALHVDSLSPRGEREICTQKFGARAITQAHRIADAYSALDFLAAHPAVDPTRIALWGWSHGGSSVLGAMRAGAAPRSEKRFAAAVAFYPGCSPFARLTRGYQPLNPLLILIGESDDWTPAAPCKSLFETAQRAALPVALEVYAGAYHGFDDPNPNAQVRVRSDVPNGVNPGAGVTVGPHPAARAQAMLRVEQFLLQTLRF